MDDSLKKQLSKELSKSFTVGAHLKNVIADWASLDTDVFNEIGGLLLAARSRLEAQQLRLDKILNPDVAPDLVEVDQGYQSEPIFKKGDYYGKPVGLSLETCSFCALCDEMLLPGVRRLYCGTRGCETHEATNLVKKN